MSSDLILAPSQACGAFRLVPLLRKEHRTDLRLGLSKGSGFAVTLPKAVYTSYIPHALILEWGDGSAPVAPLGTQLKTVRSSSPVPTGVFHRMAKRLEGRRLRFLPLHLAMEGLLALHFGGPTVQWGYFSRRAISNGMSPQSESSVAGWALEGFDEALRVFEIHDGQVGVLVFVADALAAAFVAPHPDDYRALHDSLLQDFFGELIWQYAVMYPSLPPCAFPAAPELVRSLADLRDAVAVMRQEWAAFGRTAAAGLPDVPLKVEKVYEAGPFRLERFIGSLDPGDENHIGERIIAPDGSLQYLKTFRLSAAQTRRAYLLKQLADHDWNLESIAKKYGLNTNDVLLQYENNGYGWMFHQHVVDAARAYARRKS
ncbi:Uncharacterized protein OS=Anabaena variabilis (strain ATCC 29413 / PCC 7937) GN=Ava_0052 PE=4 SV=1 [Gemmata massiliana]|uniref:ARG and Rhodanese-Phosphatase-superfamily-associated domain-containing protein n=1 Tax=Gemmata massiliana TaxID=1210884 RepID=A0A6P2D9M0_9BACT|nr:hypothetical protein [Gemmata massiliana]VTR98041.1 Uncharacterized protein OS=Anabaena variabilis (strain ATCC 29413 / PCC 7937) GN=Ava_0052 PE=4 SV=1 [Gemmata massiliana]